MIFPWKNSSLSLAIRFAFYYFNVKFLMPVCVVISLIAVIFSGHIFTHCRVLFLAFTFLLVLLLFFGSKIVIWFDLVFLVYLYNHRSQSYQFDCSYLEFEIECIVVCLIDYFAFFILLHYRLIQCCFTPQQRYQWEKYQRKNAIWWLSINQKLRFLSRYKFLL